MKSIEPPKKTDRRRAGDKNVLTKHLSKIPREHSSPSITDFEDRAAVVDARIDKVWDYLEKNEEFHPQAHAITVRKLGRS